MGGTLQEHEAISQCQAGDQEALGILFQLHHQAVFRTAYGITHNYDLAEDVTQEVFVQLMTAIKRYDPTRPFAPWLYRIAVRRSLDALRKPADRYVPIDDDNPIPAPPHTSPEPELERTEQGAAIWAAVGKLGPKHRAVVVLYYYRGFSVDEISQALGCLRPTVRVRLHYARAHLRDALRPWQEEPEEPGLADGTPIIPQASIGPGPADAKLPNIGGTADQMACSYIPARVEVDPC